MIVGPRGLSHELKQGFWWWRGWNWEQGTEIRNSHSCDLLGGWHPQDSYLSFTDPLAASYFHLGSCVSNGLFGKMALQNFIHIQLVVVVVSHSVMSDSLRPYSLPGSSVHGISQARIREWIVISFFRGSWQPRDRAYLGGGFFFFF